MFKRIQYGVSLVELMVAIAIGLFLLLGAVAVFSNSKRTYVEQEDSSRLQENLRFASEMISRDLRMAGYYGCVDTDTISTTSAPTKLHNALPSGLVTAANYTLNPTGGGIEGFEGSATTKQWQPGAVAISSSLGALVANNAAMSASTYGAPVSSGEPDAIIIRQSGGEHWPMTAQMSNLTSALTVQNTAVNGVSLAANDLATVSNCSSADLFRVSAATATAVTPASGTTLNTEYGEVKSFTSGASTVTYQTAFVSRYSPVAYYIGLGCMDPDTDSNTATCASTGPALFRQYWDNSTGALVKQQLLSGVENMQITYGIDTANSDRIPDSFVQAGSTSLDSAAEWRTVVAVRIGFLVRSLNDNSMTASLESAGYRLNDTDVNPANDHRARRMMVATVSLRNAATP